MIIFWTALVTILINVQITGSQMSTSSHKKVRHILELTLEEKRDFIDSIDTILTDCDGVIWELAKPIKGAGEAVNLLKKAGKRYGFVTNNSVRKMEDYANLFKSIGVDVDLNDLYHPARAIVQYLQKIEFNGLIYCCATTVFKNYLKEAGFSVIDGPNKILEENFGDLARHVFDKEPVKAVIVDVDFNLSAPKLIRAALYLNKPDSIFIAGATDMMLPVGHETQIIGPGPYIKVVENASGKKATVIGKPGLKLGEILMDHFEIKNPKRTLFIGDMMEQDIEFGKVCSFQTLAVLTGGIKKADFQTSEILPDFYANSMADFIEFFRQLESDN